MALNSNNYIPTGNTNICTNRSTVEKTDTESAAFGLTQNQRNDYENTEHVSSLPTVYEGKMPIKERTLSSREQLSNIVIGNLRMSVSSHDVRGEDPRLLSSFFSRSSSHESLDEKFVLRSTGLLHMPNHKVSNPLPACKTTRRRALSEAPTEALVSPVIPRRYLSPKKLKEGVSRVKSCPLISSGSNEHLSKSSTSPPVSPWFTLKELACFGSQPPNRAKFHKTPVGAYPTFTSTDQDKLPRIPQCRYSPMLVKTPKTPPTESARELFNVSPVLGESAVSVNQDNNIQCDFNDKVQYYLHTISAEKDIDQ